jgi:hypothetical protein
MATQDITQPQDNSQMVATTATGTHPQTPTNAPSISAPELNPAEAESPDDQFLAVGGKGPKKQTSSSSKKTKVAETPIQPLPRNPDVVPSPDFVRDYVKYADRYETPPLMHECIAIAGVAALANGKVWMSLGGERLPLDLWLIVLTPSGAGKNKALRAFRSLLRDAGLLGRVHQESWGSGPYVQQFFAENPSGLFIWPEMSQMIHQLKQRHFAGTQEFITNLFDETELPDSKHYRDTGDPKKPGTPSIEYTSAPRTTFLATSSLSWFFSAVTKDNVSGGFIPRWIPMIVTDPDRSVPIPAAPDRARMGPLVEKLKQIAEVSGEMDFSLVEEDYKDWYESTHQRFQSHPQRAFAMPFWRRLRNHTLKLATVYELSTSASLKVSPESMKRAIDTARIIEHNIYELVRSSFSSEGVESQNLENYIRDGEANGRSQTEVMQFLRGEKRPEALNRIAMLVDSGIAHWFERKTQGRSAMILVHADHLEEHTKSHPQDIVRAAGRK